MEAGSLESRTGAISEAYSLGRVLFFQIVLSFLALSFAHNVFAATLSYSPATQTYVTEATGYKCSATSCSTSPVFTCLYTDPCWAASGSLPAGFCSLVDPRTDYTMWSNNGGAFCSAGFSWVGYWSATSTLSYSCPSGTAVGDGSQCAICSDGSTPGGTYPNLTCDVCTVPRLTPLDPAVQPYEDGLVDMENETQATRDGAACIVRSARARHLSPQLISGYRPPAYQTHIREVYDKWQLLKNNNDAACADTKRKVQIEFDHHSPFAHQPGNTSPHSLRRAIDISLSNYADADTIAAGCNMSRSVPNDRVHFESPR